MTPPTSDPLPILDLRPASSFLAGHLPNAINIPLEQLPSRTHELPPKNSAITIFDTDPSRLAHASTFLLARGYQPQHIHFSSDQLSHTGPASPSLRLWQPSPFLLEALNLIHSLPSTPPTSPPLTPPLAPPLALDIASGSGREAVYLAQQNYTVHACDILPDALAKASQLAHQHHVHLHTFTQNVRQSFSPPANTYHLILIFRFLHRPLLSLLPSFLSPGGWLICETFHQADATVHSPPLSPSHLLADDELSHLLPSLTPHISRNNIPRDNRRFSQFLAQKSPLYF